MPKPRFVIIPGDNRFNRTQPLGSTAFVARSTATLRAPGPNTVRLSDAPGPDTSALDIVASIDSEDGVDALLVDLDEASHLDLKMRYPDLRVVEEGRAEMAFARVMLQPIAQVSMAGTQLSSAIMLVRVRGPKKKPIEGVHVQLITDPSTNPPTGAEGDTNKKGEVRLAVPKSQRKGAILRVEPAHSYWPAALTGLKWTKGGTLTVDCAPIATTDDDSLRFMGGAGAPKDGKGVVVAVIDGGAGPHEGLPHFTGRNFANPSKPSAVIKDNGIGHGTHVAGIIAGQHGGKSMPGMAPGVTLKVYRVYATNGLTTGAFAVASAIQAAVDDGADIINLSLTLPTDDLAVSRQLQRARARGVVCVAAAGNNGGHVMMPAGHDAVIGVAALGCRDCWPAGSSYPLDIRPTPKGKDPRHFIAKFSCFGSEIDLSGPGVGVLSLYPRNRLAALNGTSMAAPAVSGLIARHLAKKPAILALPRNQQRSDKIVALALSAATSLGFPARHQGRGILT